MQAWAKAVAQRLGDVLEIGDRFRECTVSMDAGADRVVLAENPEGTGRGRASIALSMADDFVEVAAHLPAEEAKAVYARIADPLPALAFTTALEALPEQFTLGIAGEESPEEAASSFTLDRLRSLLLRAERNQRPLWLGWRIPRDVAVEHAVLLDEQLEDAAVALATVFPLLLGPPAGPEAHHQVPERRDRRRASRTDDERPDAKHRLRGRDHGRERDSDLDEPEAAEKDATPNSPPIRAGTLPTVSSRARPPRAGRGAGKRIEAGTRVRVLEGPFSGKVGIVQELDGNGGARVLLGLLAVRLDLRDLARSSEGRTRPILSTSHRKPAPARS